MSRTLKAKNDAGIMGYEVVAMRGRSPENPSDRSKGIVTKQRLEGNGGGVSNALTSVQKDSMLMQEGMEASVLKQERNEYGKRVRKAYERHEIAEKRGNMRDYVPRQDGCANVLSTVQKDNMLLEVRKYSIRRLTAKECWRLMGFSDEDYEKAASVVSNTQLLKQAGNSIVKPVLMAIFSQLNIKGVKPWNEVHDEG